MVVYFLRVHADGYFEHDYFLGQL